MRPTATLLLTIMLFLYGKVSPLETDLPSVVSTHVDKNWQSFQHIAVDVTDTGSVFAAGVNTVHHLDPDLNVLQTIESGPLVNATEIGSSNNTIMSLTDDINRVLLLDNSYQSRLIVCGTAGKGSCEVRNSYDISQVIHKISGPIVASKADASTVAFIAPGPTRISTGRVLFLGVTFSGSSVFDEVAPAVASRSLDDDNILSVAFDDFSNKCSCMRVDSIARSRYRIHYVHGFASESFSYLLTVQKREGLRSGYISKIVRICHEDADFVSYTEIPLECSDAQGNLYNLLQAAQVNQAGTELAKSLGISVNEDVLFAVFSSSESPQESPEPASESALCVYSLASINAVFTQSIQRCMQGEGNRGLSFISPSKLCTKSRLSIDDGFCGLDINSPLGGTIPVQSQALLTFPVRLTAVAAKPVYCCNEVYLGTADGHLKRILVRNLEEATEFRNVTIDDGAPIRQDMFFDKEGDHIYVATCNKISKVVALECHLHRICSHCLASKDTRCGWCVLSQRCSLEEECYRDGGSGSDEPWLASKCPSVAEVKPRPDTYQIGSKILIHLSIDHLHVVQHLEVECVFRAQGAAVTTRGMIFDRREAGCMPPVANPLPRVPQGQNTYTAELILQESSNSRELVSTSLKIYDCQTYNSCSTCESSEYPCFWCLSEHRCDHGERCQEDAVFGGIIEGGASNCLLVVVTSNEDVLIPSGTVSSVRVPVRYGSSTRFECEFIIEERRTIVGASFLDDAIQCKQMSFAYIEQSRSIITSLKIKWDVSGVPVETNPVNVILYKCQLMADQCGACLSLPDHFKCGWCQSLQQCEVEDKCNRGLMWIGPSQSCSISNTTSPEFTPEEPCSTDVARGVTIDILQCGARNLSSCVDEDQTVPPLTKVYASCWGTAELFMRCDSDGFWRTFAAEKGTSSSNCNDQSDLDVQEQRMRQLCQPFYMNSKVCGSRPRYKNTDSVLSLASFHTPENRWPMVMGLKHQERYICSATLITPLFLLTAAHCVTESTSSVETLDARDLKAQLSSFRSQDQWVAQIFVFPGFKPGPRPQNDLALIRLEKPMLFNSKLYPACVNLDNKGFWLIDNTAVTFSRDIGQSAYDYGETLQQIDPLCLNSSDVCTPPQLNNSLVFCGTTLEPSKGLLRGSSGGPFMQNLGSDDFEEWAVSGVVSFRSISHGCDLPRTVFTAVQAFRSWIIRIVHCANT